MKKLILFIAFLIFIAGCTKPPQVIWRLQYKERVFCPDGYSAINLIYKQLYDKHKWKRENEEGNKIILVTKPGFLGGGTKDACTHIILEDHR